MTVRAAWLMPTGQTREDTRLAPTSPLIHETETRVRDGVLAGGAPFAATGAGSMTVQIGPGRAIVQGTDSQGAYPVANDSPVLLTFGDGAAQNARIDSVVLRVADSLFDGGPNAARIEIVQGSASTSPVPPTLPAACLRLWDVAVPAGTSAGAGGIGWGSALSDRRRYTAAAGGILPRGYGLSFSGAYEGQYRDNGSNLERWSAQADAWQTYRPPLETATVVTTGAVAATGHSLGSFHARRVGGVQSFTVIVSRTGSTITSPTGGNITDLPLVTLPLGWRPPYDMELTASDGYGDGAAVLTPSGLITLRTWSAAGTIQAGRDIRVSGCFVT
ncbi:hypothetical protein [Streptomyces antarcticus]|uniref:hypothetical protein n=1 Tax=Streptomyces antarcticus TaxID=2996458 RepID=UPI00226F648C|nr:MULTISPECIES: hypothetical protein [unclassified Streptomyces]MCY0942606.1 hypothetical protein [Streptomyces sp. H34-AA3]MCZ4081352.1 hypothetical protein [Streptomyces sp. H34-S5]